MNGGAGGSLVNKWVGLQKEASQEARHALPLSRAGRPAQAAVALLSWAGPTMALCLLPARLAACPDSLPPSLPPAMQQQNSRAEAEAVVVGC